MKEFSLSDLNRRPGEIVDAALAGPVVLRKHGRRQLVLLSVDVYDAMMKSEAGSADVVAEENTLVSEPKTSGGKLSALRQATPDDE